MRAASLTVLLSILACGCGGPELGDIVDDEVLLTVTAAAFEPEQASLGEPQGGLGVTRLYVSTSSLTLVPCDEGVREIMLGPRGYELISEVASGEVVSTSVTRWCELGLDIDPIADNAGEGVPEGAAIYIEGTDAEGTAFTLATDRSSSIRLTTSGDASFGRTPLLLTFDVSRWLSGITVADLEAMPEAAQELVDGRTAPAFALFADANGDDQLDEDEQPPIATALEE